MALSEIEKMCSTWYILKVYLYSLGISYEGKITKILLKV